MNTGFASTVPSLDLSSLTASATAAGTLTVSLTATGFTDPTGATNWLSQFSGNWTTGAGTSANMKTYLDNTNTSFGTGTLLSSLTGSISSFATSGTVSAASTNPFSLTEVVTITTGGTGLVSLDGSLSNVPEPASLAILGVSLAGIGAAARRRKATPVA